jgi:hypothetical protein
MRDIHLDFAAARTSLLLVAAMTAMLLVAACAAPPMVVTADPTFALDTIRSVYVMPFASPDDNHDAERIMTQALREQLQADGIVRVVDQPGLADAYVQGTVEHWVRGGLALSGTRPTKIRGSLALRDPAKRTLWWAVAEQWDPLRLMADGLFARDPSALAPHWVRTVLRQLPGYTVQRRPVTADPVERFLAGESIAELTRLYTMPPQEVEMLLRQALAARRNDQEP